MQENFESEKDENQNHIFEKMFKMLCKASVVLEFGLSIQHCVFYNQNIHKYQ